MQPRENHAELQRSLGWDRHGWNDSDERNQLRSYLALQLASNGLLPDDHLNDFALAQFSRGLLQNMREKTRLLAEQRAPIDQRIESFLNQYLSDLNLPDPIRVPGKSLVLDRHGMAREMSLPANGNTFQNSYVESRRCLNGIVNNPARDRRTTAGTFHVVEGGLATQELAIPGDKKVVPKIAFAKLFQLALTPPRELMVLPFTAGMSAPSHTWVSLLLRPLVCPEVEGYCRAKTMETRFFVPGSLVSNLDFVESIFGNAGDPLVSRNDAGLDVEQWSGHTGGVILAPHLTTARKKDLGLPHIDDATERQIRDRMCWSDPE